MKLPFVPHAPLWTDPKNSFAWRGVFAFWRDMAWGHDHVMRCAPRVYPGRVALQDDLYCKISDGLGGIIPGRLAVYAGCLAVRCVQSSVFGVIRWP